MATSVNNSNSVSITAFVAVDATIREFDNSVVARFPISISRTEYFGDTPVRQSALLPCECWRKSKDSETLARLTKGTLLQFRGALLPQQWTDEAGEKHSRIVFVVKEVVVPAKKAKEPAKAKITAA